MALTHFAFGKAANFGTGILDLMADNEDLSSEGLVPSAASQQTTATAPNVGGRAMCQVATDTAVYVAFGSNPDATNAALRFFLPANAVARFSVEAGDKGAVVTI
jgi:hypothetical protein